MVESVGNFDTVIAEICFLKKKKREKLSVVFLIMQIEKNKNEN